MIKAFFFILVAINAENIFAVCCLVTQSHLTFCDPHGLYSLPSSSVHGILQEWIAISFSRWDLSKPQIVPGSPEHVLHCRQILLSLSHWGSQMQTILTVKQVYLLL